MPRARAGLVVRRVGEELVVYDPATHVAHCLSRAAAVVFRAANGKAGVGAIAATLAASMGSACDEASLVRTLEELSAAGLLEPARQTLVASSRRQALRRLGLGAVALAPIVTSLVVPTPAEAAATCVPATSCTTSNPGQPCFVLAQSECVTKLCTGVAGDCQ
jgi:hypothetical protein